MLGETIFSSGGHTWYVFGRDSENPDARSQTNQVAVCFGDQTLLIDPGGFEIFPEYLTALTGNVSIDSVKQIVLTHPDSDACSSAPLWRQVCPELETISLPELNLAAVSKLQAGLPLDGMPDEGGEIALGDIILQLIPAHHLSSPAAFSVYDPVARILYSGDTGSIDTNLAADNYSNEQNAYVEDFAAHCVDLATWHNRRIVSSFARNEWLARVSDLEIDTIVPHHGPMFKGEDVQHFLKWFAEMEVAGRNDTLLLTDPLTDQQTDQQAVTEITAAVSKEFSALLGTDTPKGQIPEGNEFRLVTRSDFDGLVCAVLLEELGVIDDILFVHPNDMQEGRVEISESDITTNLPYVEGCYLAFDHHASEITRLGEKPDNLIIIPSAPSAARVVYDYYGGKETFPNVSEEMMEAVDQGDSAQYEMEDVLNPERWALLNFIMDSRTGLGRFRGFRIPNYELMMELIDACRKYSIDEIIELPDVKERVELYREQSGQFAKQIKNCTTVHGNLVILNLLEDETVYVGNRFMIYALFPECNISIHMMWGRDKQNVVFACGKSIFDRTSKTNVGELMLQYGGGGHHAAGTCQADAIIAETVKGALIDKINADG